MAEEKVIKSDFKKAIEKYPKLKLIWEEETFYCKGEVDIFDTENNYWDSFSINISISIKKYPNDFPIIFLENARIPKEDDRHINLDYSCCVEVEQKQALRAKKGITIIQFLDEYAIPHFADQLFYEKEKHWANGDYKHGFDGKIQYYKELTSIYDESKLVHLLENLDYFKNLKMYDLCFCGSGKKLKFCHKNELKTLLLLPKEKVKIDITYISNKLKI